MVVCFQFFQSSNNVVLFRGGVKFSFVIHFVSTVHAFVSTIHAFVSGGTYQLE